MKILLVGAGGYGIQYLKLLLNNQEPDITFEGIVEKYSCPMQEEIQAAGVPVYETLEAFYAEHTADLALISTPAFLHCEQSIYCVQHGTNVLCEKPAAPTVEEAEKMIRAEQETGKFIAIGFQRCYSDAFLSLKQDVLAGVLGKPVSMKSLRSVPQNYAYYARGGGYAGQISKDGRIILDSPLSNAHAHYLQELLFVLGSEMNTSAETSLVQCECLRANKISNFDTCVLKLTAAGGVPVYFSASHAVEDKTPLIPQLRFENAIVTITDGYLIATFKDGTEKNYGKPSLWNVEKKFADSVAAVKSGTAPVCTVKTTLPHVKLIGDIYRNIPIADFAESEKVYCEDRVYVSGLREKLLEAYEKECMLSEL